ncbi:MAG: CoA transferase, partial [Hyphomonadaceae bacterium]
MSELAKTGPCAGLRVLDFGRLVAGPYCALILSDLGAEVIKVEEPDGDHMRGNPANGHNGIVAGFEQYNHGKKSFVADLRTPTGIAAARALIDTADVLVENFRPGVMEKYGL